MSLDLPTLAARARGLGAHAFRRAELEELAGSPDLASLARALSRGDRLLEPIGEAPTLARIEGAVRHTAARRLRALAAWAGDAPALDVFFADQDRKSLRALLRGAMQGAPADTRLAGLFPTPRLPERALVDLARQPSAAKVGAHLFVLRHPDAGRLAAATASAHPVLLDIEVALLRGFAERSGAASRAGDANLADFVRARIDVCNLQMALTVASGPLDVAPAACFVEGGRALDGRAFAEAARSGSRLAAADRLRRALGRAPLGMLLWTSDDPVRLERAALAQALDAQRRAARLDPLGSAPLVSFMLRLEAHSQDLLRIAWGASLGAPASRVRPDSVTPWS